MKRLILFPIFISLLLQSENLTRIDVISKTQIYVNYNWTVIAKNPNYEIYSFSGRNITGEAYSFGDKATSSTFGNEIENHLIPRNWEDSDNPGHPANPSSEYTGIDCSGFVTRCWFFDENLVNNTNANDLVNYTISIIDSIPKAGDLWWNSEHVFIQSSVIGFVLESNPTSYENQGQRVQLWDRGPLGFEKYSPYSIFPQFYDSYPGDGEVVEIDTTLDISIRIKASGTITSSGVSMFVNGDRVSSPDLQAQDSITWQLTAQDYDVSEGGIFTVNVTARNDIAGNGYLDTYEWRFIVNNDSTPPMVFSTNPSNGEQRVPVDLNSISIKFSKSMDTVTTENAILINPDDSFSTFWGDEKTIILNLEEHLNYCEDYTVTITDEAIDIDGIKLDGNTDEDGEPGGDHKFSFYTETPCITHEVKPENHTFKIPPTYDIYGEVKIDGSSLKDTVTATISKTVTGDNDSIVFEGGEGSLLIKPDSIYYLPFTVISEGQGRIYVYLELKSECLNKICFASYSAINIESEEDMPGHDHPDDNLSPGEVAYSTGWIIEPDSVYGEAKVGIFPYGWTKGFGHLIGRYKISTIPVFSDLKYWKNPEENLWDVIDLLVIGSGALDGFDSPDFKERLDEYVVNGGNLLVLTQKYGSDFTVLPGDLDGDGWHEDQSCSRNAVYLNKWHPVFSGQTRHWIDCHVDGYFTQFPYNTDILLRRRVNGKPALLSYLYGLGTVVVTSAYSDWGYGHNQVSDEELPLMRDLTTWAMNPEMNILEFYPDSLVSVPILMRYEADDTLEATTAIIKVLNPDRVLYDSLNISVSLNRGEEFEWVWSDEVVSEHLGLWVIDYTLMSESGRCIQSYTRGAIFSQRVDVPTGEYYNLGDFEVSVNSSHWEVIPGDSADYEISITNNTDTSFTGKLIIGLYEEIDEQRIWRGAVDSITGVMILPDTSVMISYPRVVQHSNYIYFGLYENDQWYYSSFFTNALAVDERWTSVIRHPFSITISLDKNPYLIGNDTVHYKTKIKNKLPYPCSLYVEHYTILDSIKYSLRSDTLKVQASDKIFIYGEFYPLDYDSTISGKQEIVCNVYYKDSLWNSKTKYFDLIYSDIQCQIILPDYFFYNDSNSYKVILHSEEGYLPSGELILTSEGFCDSIQINFSYISDTTFIFNYPHKDWHLNDYIKAEYKYGEQKSSLRKNLPFSSPSYSDPSIKVDAYENTFLPGNMAEFTGRFDGRGKLFGAPLIGWLFNCPPGGDTLFDTTFVNPDSISYISLETYIDTTNEFGQWYSYDYGIKYLDQIYKGTESQGYRIHPPLAILNPPGKDTFSIEEEIPITYINPIKNIAKVRIDSVILCGNNFYHRDIGPGEVTILPESSYTYQFNTPDVVSGYYKLKVFSEAIRGEGVGLDFFMEGGYWRIFLKGIESQLTVNSDKEWFRNTDSITLSSLINNGDFPYQGAESLFVYPFEETSEIFNLDLDTFYKFGVKLNYDSLDGKIALIDSACSLYAINNYYLYEIQGGSDIIKDEFGNVWILCNKYSKSHSNKLFKVSAKKYKSDFSKVLLSFSIPVNWAYDFVVKNGWMYIIDKVQHLIRKLNPSSGDLVDSWGLYDGKFSDVCGISIDDEGKIIVLENDLKKLYKFTNNGCLVDSLNLPSSFKYKDLDFRSGKAYILAGDRILTVSNGLIDTFMISNDTLANFTAISVSKDGKVAIVNKLESHDVILFSAEGELEVKSTFWIGYDDLTFSDEDILLLDYSVVDRRKKYGFDRGLLIYDSWYMGNYFPPGSMFIDYYKDDELHGGSIGYKGRIYPQYSDDYNEVSIESMKGSSPYLFDVLVEMEGKWQNSPIFKEMSLEMKNLLEDTVIYSSTHQFDLQPSQNYLIGDTIIDSILPGDYAIIGDIYNDNGQFVNSDIDYFTVIEDEISLIMHHDTNNVPPGWIFEPDIKVVNPLPDSEPDLHLAVKNTDSIYIDSIFTIDSSEVFTFPLSISPLEPTSLYGELIFSGEDTIKKEIILNVLGGIISLDVSAPEYVDLKPFGVVSRVENNSAINQNIVLNRRVGSDSIIDTITVYSGDTIMILDSFSIVKYDSLIVKASGIFGIESERLPIGFGINSEIILSSMYQVAPDSVEMFGIISNEGIYPVNLIALFCITDSSNNKKESKYLSNDAKLVGKELSFFEFVENIVNSDIDTSLSYLRLNVGEVDTISIMFDYHEPGSYALSGFVFTDTPVVLLDSVYSSVKVIEKSLISIDSIFAFTYSDSNGLVQLGLLVGNESYNPFLGNLTITSSFCYLDTVVDINSHCRDTIIIKLNELIDEGEYEFTSTIKEGGTILDKMESELYFSSNYYIDSIPEEIYVSAGDTGIIYTKFSNIGNSKGVRRLSVEWADVINLVVDTTLNPGASAYLTQDFYVPLDMPGGQYYCNVSILNGSYPEVDTFIPLVIEGVSIEAKDSLDKMVYEIGDTADFSLLIRNETFWSGSLDAAIQYGNFQQDSSFILGGMENGVLNKTIPRDTLYLDVSGIYMFDPINTENFDSAQILWNASSDSIIFGLRTDSVIGGGAWFDIDDDLYYQVEDWTQIKIMNEVSDTGWVDSIVLFFNPTDTIIIDVFPVQKEKIYFSLPVNESQKRAGWGIYHPTGRAIVLDERYLYLKDDSLTIYTDKSRYLQIDTVNATLWKHFPDTNFEFHYWVYFSPTDIVCDSFLLVEDTSEFYFSIPRWVRSGSYSIDYWLTEVNDKVSIDSDIIKLSGDREKLKRHPAKEWAEGKSEPEKSDSIILSGKHSFDVDGIAVYIKNAKMDTNWYNVEDTASIWMDISSDESLDCSLILSSTGEIVDTISLSLLKDIPNTFEFGYILSGCTKGVNELYPHLIKDEISLAGEVLYFDVYIPDSISPIISIIEEPANTYSSSQLYKITALIWNPDSNQSEIYDTLYYRLSSIGGSGWNKLQPHSVKGDTHKYLIPSQPNGSHVEYHINVRDESNNLARYPYMGEGGFWILESMKPTWSELTYTRDTTAILNWNPPKELISYHCGLNSYSIPLWERTVATRFIPQYLPAKLNKIGISLINEDFISKSVKHVKEELWLYMDTVVINIYEVNDSIPGDELYSYSFIKVLNNYEVFNVPHIQIPEEGLFVEISASAEVNAVLDGFGRGIHTAISSEEGWILNTEGEVILDGFISYIPDDNKSPSSILSFNLLRKLSDTNWAEITSGIIDTTFLDTAIIESNEYSYKVEANFLNPADTFSSSPGSVFIDLAAPVLDTVMLSFFGDTIIVNTILLDTSGILWDSLGYKVEDSILVIPEDSCAGNMHYFSIQFTEDTLFYYLIACDSSLIENYARYPETNFYKWANTSGVPVDIYPDSTYLADLPENPVTREIELKYALSKEGKVRIFLYDVVGRVSKIIVDKVQEGGYYTVPLNGQMMPQGVYFLRMRAGGYERTLKLIKLQ